MIQAIVNISGGRIVPLDLAGFKAGLDKYEGKRCIVTVKQQRRMKSCQQRKYYFAVIVKTLAKHLGYGRDDRYRLHISLKWKFLKFVDEHGLDAIPSYENDLDVVQRNEYHEEIRRWALMEWQLPIPLPNEVDLDQLTEY